MWRISIFLRFLALAPTGWYGVVAATHAIHMAKFPVLRRAPYKAGMVTAQRVAGGAGVIVFIWTILMWVPTSSVPPGGPTLLMGFADLVVTGFLFTGIVLQSHYIPRTYGACNDVLHFGGVPPDTPSVFKVMNATASVSDLKSQCKSYVLEWGFGNAALALYILMTLWHLLFFNMGDRGSRSDDRGIGFALRWMVAIVFFPITFAILLYKLLDDKYMINKIVQTLTHYWKRVVQKWRARNDSKGYSPLNNDSEKINDSIDTGAKQELMYVPRKQTIDSQTQYEPWLPFDVLVLISQHLHQKDLVNLSMTSKQVRASLGNIYESNTRLTNRFSRFTCLDSNRQKCWGCGIQTCKGCQYWSKNLDTLSANHATNCQPTCSACMKYSFTNALNLRGCYCNRELRSAWWYVSNLFPPDVPLAPSVRFVCQNCSIKDLWELLAIRTARDVAVQKQLAKQPTHCHYCSEALPESGAQFWTCTMCTRECQSDMHPCWRRKEVISQSCELVDTTVIYPKASDANTPPKSSIMSLWTR